MVDQHINILVYIYFARYGYKSEKLKKKQIAYIHIFVSMDIGCVFKIAYKLRHNFMHIITVKLL